MNQEEEDYVNMLKQSYDMKINENSALRQGITTTMFSKEQDTNLVKWQLDIQEELERIEHLLRKHIPRRDKDGNEYFEEPKEKDRIFNETGVQEILHIR